MIIQNFAQLDSVYGKDDAQTIRSNCNNMLYLLTTELSALKEISELCGDKIVKVGKGDKEREETRPLATVADLQRMKPFEAVIRRIRLNPYKTRLKPNFEMDWGEEKVEADPFVERQKQPIKVFDLREFVKEKRKNKFMNMVEGNAPGGLAGFGGGMMPPTGMPGMNPFEALAGSSVQPESPSGGLNVDELVKKIDAKIAELEKEEQEEAEKRKKIEESKKQEVNKEEISDRNVKDEENKESEIESSKPIISESLSNIAPTKLAGFINKTADEHEKLKVENKEEHIDEMKKGEKVKNSDVSKYVVTDDQFFDDFFDE